MTTLQFRNATSTDLERCFEIESVAYAGDEAASKEKIRKRIETWPQGFLVLENDREIVGFINSGCAHQVELDDENFKEMIGHDPNGKKVVIMSVVVHPEYQRKGMSNRLMQRFIENMKTLGKADIFLICQTELIPMYASHDFVHLGLSNSAHGGLSWHEMSLTL